MKILEVNTEKTWRGGERQTYYNIKGFKEAGEDVELLALKNFPLEKETRFLNILIHAVRCNKTALAWLIKYGKIFDIIHVQTAKALTLAVLTKPFHKRPVVYTRRVDFVPKGKLTLLKYRLADKIIAITTPIKEILENFGVNNIDIITDIVEEKSLNRNRALAVLKEKGITDDKKIVATISAFVPHKDTITMIKTVKELSGFRKDFVFLHFGSGEMEQQIRRAIKEQGLEDKYILMGFHKNVEDFYSVFDVFVMSSEQEGLGSSVLDAFVYKIPVVSTDAGGLKESVGDRGLLCPVKDYRCLAESINKILDDEKSKQKLVKKGFEKAKAYHSIEKVTKQYIEVFKNI